MSTESLNSTPSNPLRPSLDYLPSEHDAAPTDMIELKRIQTQQIQAQQTQAQQIQAQQTQAQQIQRSSQEDDYRQESTLPNPIGNESMGGEMIGQKSSGKDDKEGNGPEVTGPEVTSPEVTSPEVTSPEVTSPEATSPEVTNPDPIDPAEAEQDQLLIQQRSLIVSFLTREFGKDLPIVNKSVQAVILRLTKEVQRICEKSDRIQRSGEVETWLMNLAQHRLNKCLSYYKLGSKQGRVELHSTLSAMVYRHINPGKGHFGFQARYNLIEDFLQNFYIEVLKNFRKENELPLDYQPRTKIELAEYMTFSEQYAKRRISLPGRRNQQLVVLRAQAFSQRQPQETSMDIELAVESGRGEEAEQYSRSPIAQQIRHQMVDEAVDPSDSVLRDRVTNELVNYLEAQGQTDCVNYLVLKLQDLSAPEIDEVLNLTPRQRDYLQQRFKYHVEKFACSAHWQMVHQWLGADLDQNLGMPQYQWEAFLHTLQPQQRKLLELKQEQLGDRPLPSKGNGPDLALDKITLSDQDIAKILKCTPKQVQRGWVRLLNAAWKFRNTALSGE